MGARSKTNAILFDLDGTLVDTAPDLIQATNQLRIEHGKIALPTEEVREVVSLGGAALTRLALGDEATQSDHQRLLTLYAASLGDKSQLFDGLDEVMSLFHQTHMKWGIVTNKERRFAEPLLARLSLQPGALVCGDDLPYSKPDPRPLLSAARFLDVEAETCIYIGDHQRDIEAAHRSHMGSIAAAYGYLSDDMDPVTWKADQIVYSSLELAKELKTLLKTE